MLLMVVLLSSTPTVPAPNERTTLYVNGELDIWERNVPHPFPVAKAVLLDRMNVC